jgi:hypothetical protein
VSTPAEPTPEPRHVDEVFAWLVSDTQGNESIASIHVSDELTVPLMFGEASRARRFIPTVRKAARELGAPARLVRFTRQETVYEAEPL